MNCVLFIGNRNKQSLNEIENISNCMPSDYCIIWAYNFSSNIKGIYEKDVQKYQTIAYTHKQTRSALEDYLKIVLHNIDTFINFDYIYVTHSDVHFTGSYSDLFKKCERSNADYLGTHIHKYPIERTNRWQWINEYIDNKRYATDGDISSFIGSFARFFRISKGALQYLYTYNKTDITDFAYELYMPTLLWNMGFKLSAIDDVSDKEFLSDIMIAMNTTFYPGNTSDRHSCAAYPNMLFNGYTIKDNEVVENVTTFGKQPFEPSVSIIIPIVDKFYKSSLLEFAYTQYKNCEIIIVDECEDNEAEQYAAQLSCIYIKKKKTGKAECINCGIRHASSSIIMLQSPYDMIDEERVTNQIESLKYCAVSIFGTSSIYYGDSDVTLSCLKDYDFIYSSIAFKKDVIKKTGLFFEQNYYAFTKKFIYNALMSGCKVCTFEYSAAHYNGTLEPYNEDEDADVLYLLETHENNPELTCIITFRNEGDEVLKTVESIRSTANNVSIILINDGSEDATDYKKVADTYHCTYIKHKEAIGCGLSRDDGVAHCQTKYFILLDAHMRFYEMNWDERLLNVMKQLPEDSILSANTSVITKDKDGYYINEDGQEAPADTHGSKFDIRDTYWFDVKWTHKYISATKIDNVYEIGCVLGAGYCTSVDHWNRIGGLKGLHIYGLDEALMSFKTWAYGGHNYILYDFYIGHIYRDSSPFKNTTDILESNRIFCLNAFIEDKSELNTALDALKNRIGETLYNKAYTMYLSRQSDMYDVRHDFLQKRKHTLQEFIELNKKL